MHKEQKDYLDKIKEKFPEAFKDRKVLDIGSFNVNGNEKPWFDNCDFIGLDLLLGPGVDVACPANEYNEADNTFDTIISVFLTPGIVSILGILVESLILKSNDFNLAFSLANSSF